MPRKYVLTEALSVESEEVNCRICGTLTRETHMAIDSCRPCAVFYKRLRKSGKRVSCKTGLRQCDLTTRGNTGCKKCRYDRILEALNDGMTPLNDENAPSISSSKSTNPSPTTSKSELNVLSSMRQAYTAMNRIRRASELSARTTIPDKQIFVVDGMIVIPATFNMYNENTRIFTTSLFEFASTSFVEFNTLDNDDKWLLIRNFYPLAMILDSEYRMIKHLPEKENMIFASYTSYINRDTVDIFFSDTPSDVATKQFSHDVDRTRFIVDILECDSPQVRAKMKRWNPSEDEFIAFLGICFWSLDKISVSDKMHKLAEQYRSLLFVELDKLYRDSLCLDDYAARMGEAAMFISSIQETAVDIRSKLGVLKLFDVIWEEMILTQLLQ